MGDVVNRFGVPLTLELMDNDGEIARNNGVVVCVLEVIKAAEYLMKEVDEPQKEREPEDIPEVDHGSFLTLSDPTFRNDFRMSKVLFEDLFMRLSPHLVRVQESKVDDRIQLLMALWILATPDSFRSVGRKFGVQKSTVHFAYVRMINALNLIAEEFLKWPTLHEQEEIIERYLQRGPFPRVVGALDGCSVRIHKPTQDPGAFYDRKGHYSIHLQAVCDDSLTFRDVYIGECGSVHDSTVFKRSPLSRMINNQNFWAPNSHILADAAYGLQKTVMVPYKRANLNDLDDAQKNFNHVLSKSRISIENAFARLQTKWRRMLVMLDVIRLDYAVLHIMACCVLHNFVIRGGEGFPEADEAEVAERLRQDGNMVARHESDSSEGEDDFEDIADAPVVGNARGRARQERREAEAKRHEITLGLPIVERRQLPRRRGATGRGGNHAVAPNNLHPIRI